MTNCFAYIRVSTIRQGQHGVSLQEQRLAIEAFSARHGIAITEWFEEQETAGKLGRPVFGRMLKLLRHRKAAGVVFHKIDRSSRNPRDWADISELIDSGLAVHFANDALDLASNTGRLAADIQATIAAHYVRNLREEIFKGLRGRLRQGIFPFTAPLGYLDQGGGKVKTLDPVRAPLVKLAFEFYSSGRFSLRTLTGELNRRGLRNRNGRDLTLNNLATFLHNPFYTGRIRIKCTGEVYAGAHEPLISEGLFQDVQERLAGRTPVRTRQHDFEFKMLIRCALCNRRLCGELQKGHVYYRCHERSCPMTAIREDRFRTEVLAVLESIRPNATQLRFLEGELKGLADHAEEVLKNTKSATQLQLENLKSRLARLTDAFGDGLVDSDLYRDRKESILSERARLVGMPAHEPSSPRLTRQTVKMFELAGKAWLSYKTATTLPKRELLSRVSSNLVASPFGAFVRLSQPFREMQSAVGVLPGADDRNTIRTEEARLDSLIEFVTKWIAAHPEEAEAITSLASSVPSDPDIPQDTREGEKRKAA